MISSLGAEEYQCSFCYEPYTQSKNKTSCQKNPKPTPNCIIEGQNGCKLCKEGYMTSNSSNSPAQCIKNNPLGCLKFDKSGKHCKSCNYFTGHFAVDHHSEPNSDLDYQICAKSGYHFGEGFWILMFSAGGLFVLILFAFILYKFKYDREDENDDIYRIAVKEVYESGRRREEVKFEHYEQV